MNVNEIKKKYDERKKVIKSRLNDFSKIKNNEIFYELCFCLLTPQSNAEKCDKCVFVLKNLNFYDNFVGIDDLKNILRDKTRFYKNKSNYLIELKDNYEFIYNNIINSEVKNNINKNKEIREFLVDNVKGLGYKEASHFLRNVGFTNLSILDRHILSNLYELRVIDEIPKTLTKKKYFEIEKKFYEFSEEIGIKMDELDLLFWSIKTGKVFK